MNKRGRVVIYGKTLFLSAVASSLGSVSGLEIIQADSDPQHVAQTLEALAPKLIIFDLTTGDLPDVVVYLARHPEVQVVGLDVNRGTLSLLSNQEHPALTLADLVSVVSE